MRATPASARLVPAFLSAALLALAACKSSSPASDASAGAPDATKTAKISNEYEVAAKVVSVTPEDRGLSLRREDGQIFDVQVAPTVPNFERIAVGDSLRVRYRETLAAVRLPAGEPLGPVVRDVVSARAQPGREAGAGIGAAVRMRVRVESVDLERGVVVFAPSSGELIARRIQTQEGRKFASGLKPGDVVQLEYQEMAALAVEKP